MTLILVILGIVGLAIDSQFNGQEAISFALLIIGAVLFIAQVLVGLVAAREFKRRQDSFNDRWSNFR